MSNSPLSAELLVRLRERVVIRPGEPITVTLPDGSVYSGCATGDTVQTRNPDGEEAATTIEHQAETIERLTAEAAAFESAFRIRVWNACRASNMTQDAAILAVEKAVKDVRTALTTEN